MLRYKNVMKMYRIILCLLLLLTTHLSLAGNYDVTDLNEAYAYLNKLRVSAGLTELAPNSLLQQSAFNHANYLADNFQGGHFETEGVSGFTGVEPKDRTSQVGYHSLTVSENVSANNSNSTDSIDGLMSAIYHRLGFLDLVNDEVGIGIAHVSKPNSYSAYVYNMGNSQYNALCQGDAFTGAGSYYLEVCQPNINLDAVAFDAVTQQAQGNNPTLVLWPVEGDNKVLPAFFEESPDPLPDYSVSGYPISIQFNPLNFTTVKLNEFKLYQDVDNVEVKPTRLLNNQTDPNSNLTELQFALFPLTRLEWNTAYRVEAKYVSGEEEKTLVWRFKTRSLGVPFFTLSGNGEKLTVPTTAEFAVYVPPTDKWSEIGALNYSFSKGLTVDTNFVDMNTLIIKLSGTVGQTATFKFDGNRSFTLTLSADATLPDNNSSTATTDTTTDTTVTTVELPTLANSAAVSSAGKVIKTLAQFTGGIAVNQGSYQKQVVQNLVDQVDVQGKIKVDKAHTGKIADIIVYAEATLPPDTSLYYFMLAEGLSILPWNQDPSQLVAFIPKVKLKSTQQVPLYQGTFFYPGSLKVHFGYRLENGTLVTSGEPIEVTINE